MLSESLTLAKTTVQLKMEPPFNDTNLVYESTRLFLHDVVLNMKHRLPNTYFISLNLFGKSIIVKYIPVAWTWIYYLDTLS